jgi:hypothetical protein
MPGNQNITATASLVYSPSPAGTSHLFLSNLGRFPVYVGQAGVTAANGLPVYPNQNLDLSTMPVNLYAASGYTKTATATTTTADVTAGTGTVAVTSGTGIANGALILIGSGGGQEVLTVISGGTTTTLTTSAPLYDHVSGEAVTVVTSVGGQINVVAGTT